MKKILYISGMVAVLGTVARGQEAVAATSADSIATRDSVETERDLSGVTVRASGSHRLYGAVNAMKIGRDELFKAACCNLGESFTTNPSVDVNYSDAATGAKQIKLLGLPGIYVQMLTENIPNFRGAASPYSLGYVPGPWMHSIQVSKGCASVKYGYESMTGQINVEYKKPEDTQGAEVNVYANTKTRTEANVDANVHLNKKLSTEVLGHFENSWKGQDENDDGFYDMPTVRQYNFQNRWKYQGDRYIFHGGLVALNENRKGGQIESLPSSSSPELFGINVKTERYEAYTKHGFILNPEKAMNIALITSASMHEENAKYGHKYYYVNEKNAYASLMFEGNLAEGHNLSAGLSVNYDYLGQDLKLQNALTALPSYLNEKETTPGAYAQYTLDLNHKFIAMAGLRVDHSSVYGTFVTPRFNVKFAPVDAFSLRLSAGKGYRTVHALAENNYLLASGRNLVVDNLRQEAAWNYGASASLNIPLFSKMLKVNLDYYYTDFSDQAIVDYDTNPNEIHITNLDGKSFSHTFQVDATYPFFEGFTLTAAYRYNDVKATYGGLLMEKPLTSKFKGLLTASYKTPLGIWQFDATLQANGGGRMPEPYANADGTSSWNSRFDPYYVLNAQITRWFRHFSIYVGGENLTGFMQKNPIISATDPWSSKFDPTMIWGPVDGRMIYAGIRINIGRL